jgi:hypothetical protein
MKKLFTLAVLFAATLAVNAQTVTNAGEEGANNPYIKSNPIKTTDHVYGVYLGDESRAALGITDAQYTYIGTDATAGRPLYNWDGTSSIEENSDINSYGVMGESLKFVAGTSGWSGWGEAVNEANPIDLSGITSDYTLHFSVRTTKMDAGGDFKICMIEGLGKDGVVFDLSKLGVVADGSWYNVDITGADLLDLYGLDFTTATYKTFAKKNLIWWLFGVKGNNMQMDSFFFYGPTATTGITNVSTKAQNADVLYNLAGQRVAKGTKGILIQNGRKIVVK